ncbi:MAG: BatA and WFA domain-containing protein [Candidatus Poribacteria bacterium]|nr:BatA and WFA domain-containing protein [Candidatus Poribacteria bacterium]
MAFLNPAAFYLIGAIPIVIALHFLKLRRQRYVVPSIMLWRASAEDQKANVPFQRLRNLLLPILQSLLLLVIIVSVARPALRIPGIVHGKIIFIVDNSASMLSKEMGETRLALAKQEVLKHINQVSASGGIMIMATDSPKPYIQQAFTTDKDKLQRAVQNIVPTHAAGELTSVFDQAKRYVDSSQDQIFFISDSFENLPDTSVPNKIAIGEAAENIGIVQFNVERIADQYTILARIQNWTDTEREINIALELEGGTAIDEKTLTLAPKEVKSVLFSINAEGLEGVAVSLHLLNADDFDLDNRVWAILNPKKQFRILLVSDRDQSLLIELLRSYGDRVELQTVSTDEFHGTGDADVIIFDGGIALQQNFLNVPGTESIIVINSRRELPFVVEPSIEIVTTLVSVIKEDRTHPIMQDVSIIGLQVKESVHRELPLWGNSLIESEKGALVWLGTEANKQFLVFEFDAFNPEISDFLFTIPDAPIFVYQCLEWLEAGTVPIKLLTLQKDKAGQIFRTGEQLKIDIPTLERSTIQVKKPDSSMIELDSEVFTETDQIGVYSVFAGDSLFERFAVNLLDASESALSFPTTESSIEKQVNEKDLIQPLTREIWQWTALFAVCLLLCEWWFYHRS